MEERQRWWRNVNRIYISMMEEIEYADRPKEPEWSRMENEEKVI